MQELRLILMRLRRMLRHRGRTADEADDLIQEACLKLQVYCQDHKIDKTENFLVRTVLNLVADAGRRERVRAIVPNALETLPLVDFHPGPHEVYAARERLQRLKAGLDALSPRAREVFMMHRLDGLSHEQVARELGITLSMVEKHSAKAMLFLTNWMQEEEDE